MRLPEHLRKGRGDPVRLHHVKKILREGHVSTVCEEARCPNIGECFSEPTATFLLLGDVCTRQCTFCAVSRGRPGPPDPGEPRRVAEVARRLGLSHVVLTSVTRDDLPDGGARHFAHTVKETRTRLPLASIEVLTPDFRGHAGEVDGIVEEGVDIFSHNLETIPRLYQQIRPQADYRASLSLLDRAARSFPHVLTKSGIMLGLGERKDEIVQVMKDLRSIECDILTIGQYLRPERDQCDIVRYIPTEEFDEYKAVGREMGFFSVLSAPFVRSSYHAKMTFTPADIEVK